MFLLECSLTLKLLQIFLVERLNVVGWLLVEYLASKDPFVPLKLQLFEEIAKCLNNFLIMFQTNNPHYCISNRGT